ncbi:MAG: M16 family metallopeptidase [Candidatus Acidiferrales bacterium]
MRRYFIAATFALLLLATSAAAQQSSLKLPPYKKTKLPNGLTVLLMEHREVPIVSFEFAVKAGSVADPRGKEGTASLTADLLRKGTKSRTAEQIAAQLDFIGGQFDAGARPDESTASAEFLKKDLATGLELLADILLHPSFPAEEFTKLQEQRIDGIRSAKDRAQAVMSAYFNGYLFGSHPYGRPTGGDEKSLAAIARDDVVQFYQAHYVPANAILAVVGDFSAVEMEKLIAQKFGAWSAPASSARSATAAKLAEPALVKGKRLLLVDKPDSTQTFFRIGNVGISDTHPDRVPVQVVNTLFGGRFTSMLNSALRIESGLTYGAGSFFDQRRVSGPFAINSYTQNETTEKAIDMALDILTRLHTEAVSEAQLTSAKNYIKGQFPPDIETSDQLANLLVDLELRGLDEREINQFYAKVDAITVADARRVIKEHFPLDNLVFLLIGKASEIAPVLKKYAARLDKKSISDPGF